METEEKTEFKFSELSDRAKQKALERYAEPEHNWWEDVYANKKEEGKTFGFAIEDIFFSGFWSQGDGACWTGVVRWATYFRHKQETAEGPEFTKLEALIGLIEDGWVNGTLRIYQNGRAVHEDSMRVEELPVATYEVGCKLRGGAFDGADPANLIDTFLSSEQCEELEEEILEAARDFARGIYKALEEEYEWLTGEENFAEIAELNDWKFYEEGEML